MNTWVYFVVGGEGEAAGGAQGRGARGARGGRGAGVGGGPAEERRSGDRRRGGGAGGGPGSGGSVYHVNESDVAEALADLGQLRELDLSKNAISDITNGAFASLPVKRALPSATLRGSWF